MSFATWQIDLGKILAKAPNITIDVIKCPDILPVPKREIPFVLSTRLTLEKFSISIKGTPRFGNFMDMVIFWLLMLLRLLLTRHRHVSVVSLIMVIYCGFSRKRLPDMLLSWDPSGCKKLRGQDRAQQVHLDRGRLHNLQAVLLGGGYG